MTLLILDIRVPAAELIHSERDLGHAIVAIAQGLYALGAALSIIGTVWSIAFIVLVQLNYAVAPRLPWRVRAP